MTITLESTADLLGAARSLRPQLEAHGAAGEAGRELPAETVAALRDAGLFRLWVPKAFGGYETDHRTAYRIFEEVSAADGSAGWVLNQSAAVSVLATMMSGGGEEIFADPDALFAGALWPPGTATPVDGGYLVTARCPFVSGVAHARWILAGAAIVVDGAPQMLPSGAPDLITVLFDPADVQVVDTWNTLGMRGTGSNDIVADEVFVPASRTAHLFDRGEPAPWATHPIYAVPPWYAVQAHACTPLGVARAAVERLLALSATKVPAFFQTAIIDRSTVHAQAAEALGHVEAALGYLGDVMDDALAAVAAGTFGARDKARLQISGAHAGRAARTAVDLVHQAVGTTAIRDGAGFERLFRDVNTITQHGTLQSVRFADAGRVLHGLDSEWFPFLL